MKMHKTYKQLNEVVHTFMLDNGLEVIIIPKYDYRKSFVCFATKYGALINRFVPYGEEEFIDVPLGIAHFLEHKMFEMPDGTDATDLFAELGLDSNAATNYNLTAYLFSGTANIKEGINLLLDYVQEPHFTDYNVAKEQGIIDQELKMYLDNPGEALNLGIMGNLFKDYPLKHDIGGTVESIKDINVEYLYQCYNTFYHPSNMNLIIVGDPNLIMDTKDDSINKLLNLIKENQAKKTFRETTDIRKSILVEDEQINMKTGSRKMDISVPKVAVAIKLPFEKHKKNEAVLKELKLKVLIESSIGPTTPFYQELIDNELINGSLYYDVYIDGIAGFIKLQANTYKPNELITALKDKLLSLNKISVEEEIFNRFKKSVLGGFLKGLDSLDFIGFAYLEYLFKDSDIFEAVELFSKLKSKDLKELSKYFKKDAFADYTIYPKLPTK
jgi:insulysin